MFETMASFMLVEHANGAMFALRWVPRSIPVPWRRTGGRTAPATATSPR